MRPEEDKLIIYSCCVSSFEIPTEDNLEMEKINKRKTEDLVSKLAAESKEMGAKNITTMVGWGLPKEQCIIAIKSAAPDFVVCGSRGLGFVKKVLMGSVSDHVLKNAPCNVIIAK